MVDILRKFEAFDEFYSDVVEPIVDSVNEFYYLLENWQDHIEDIDLGLGLRDARDKVLEVKGLPFFLNIICLINCNHFTEYLEI